MLVAPHPIRHSAAPCSCPTRRTRAGAADQPHTPCLRKYATTNSSLCPAPQLSDLSDDSWRYETFLELEQLKRELAYLSRLNEAAAAGALAEGGSEGAEGEEAQGESEEEEEQGAEGEDSREPLQS